MTQSVSFQIPVGWERYVLFHAGPDYGIASVAFAGEVYQADTYAPEPDTIVLRLPETPSLVLLQNSLLRCALFAVLAALCTALPYGCVLIVTDNGASSLQDKLHKYRFLFEELVHRDFTKKYKRTALGMAWSVLLPLLQLLVLYVVFSAIFASDIPHYVTYLFSGQLAYNYFVEATNQGMSALLENAPIFTKVNLPKYLFVFSKNISSLISFLLTLIVFFIFCWLDQITFSWKFILLLYPIVCLVLFNIGFGMILSALNVFFRDTQYLYSIFTTILMWCSAIFFSVDQFSPTAQKNFLLNPVYVYIRYFRMITIEGTVPSIGYHLWAFGYAILAVVVGFAIYKKYNHRFLYYV
ncbi:MAG: ABC transporter permease [Oscillospiraceae bacterium]|nr:ABC transporter permease [Oscillospiraceae bacterium]